MIKVDHLPWRTTDTSQESFTQICETIIHTLWSSRLLYTFVKWLSPSHVGFCIPLVLEQLPAEISSYYLKWCIQLFGKWTQLLLSELTERDYRVRWYRNRRIPRRESERSNHSEQSLTGMNKGRDEPSYLNLLKPHETCMRQWSRPSQV